MTATSRGSVITVTLATALALLLCLISVSAQAQTAAVEARLKAYQADGAGPFSAEAGGALWMKSFQHNKAPASRNCASCHGKDLTQVGQHIRTKREIEPMAPSVNPKRLTDERDIKKWLRRNCNWTMGRECTPQEKGDLLLWIQAQ